MEVAVAATTAAAPAFRCLLCTHGDGAFVLRKECFVLTRCRRCGLVQQDPLPPAEAYDARYADAATYCAELLRERDLFLRRDSQLVADLARDGATGPLLDVGAGAGILMEAARSAGWEAVGLELAQPSIDRIRGELRMEVHPCAIERAPLAAGRFGAVTFSHSLEHLRDPLLALKSAARLLRPGGLVHVAVPNWHAAKRLAAGVRLPWIFEEHLSYFTRATLRDALERAGFELLALGSGPMACAIDWRFAVVLYERTRVDRLLRRFLRMGPRPLTELLTDNVRVDCPPWRFQLVLKATRALLAAWPERFFSRLGRGEELRATARRS